MQHAKHAHIGSCKFLSKIKCLHQNYFEIFIGYHVFHWEGNSACTCSHSGIADPVFTKIWLAVMIGLYRYSKSCFVLLQGGNMTLSRFPLEECSRRQQWGSIPGRVSSETTVYNHRTTMNNLISLIKIKIWWFNSDFYLFILTLLQFL